MLSVCSRSGRAGSCPVIRFPFVPAIVHALDPAIPGLYQAALPTREVQDGRQGMFRRDSKRDLVCVVSSTEPRSPVLFIRSVLLLLCIARVAMYLL